MMASTNLIQPEAPPRALRRPRRAAATCLSAVLAVLAAGCGVAEQNIALGLGVGTLAGGSSPGHELEQVYYLGVFDRQDQVQPTVYRLTVRGQASAISGMKFGSGWVHASVIDAINTRVGFARDSERAAISGPAGEVAGDSGTGGIEEGRRLVMFGPEGFREAPKDHRLVMVMGASPETFFSAIDTSLGLIAQVRRDQIDPSITRQLVEARERLRGEQRQLAELGRDVASEMPEAK